MPAFGLAQLRTLGPRLAHRLQAEDLPRVAALAATLVRMHHAVDPARFFLPDDAGAVVLVAASRDRIDGSTYGTIEGRDWNLLLDAHGAIMTR